MAAQDINVEEWTAKLMGKKVIVSGQVQDGTKEVSEDEIRNGVSNYRIVKPGMMMTMDYREDRLNVHINQAGIVENVRIG